MDSKTNDRAVAPAPIPAPNPAQSVEPTAGGSRRRARVSLPRGRHLASLPVAVVAILAISGVTFAAKWVPAPIVPPWVAAPVVVSTPTPAPASTPIALEAPSFATAGPIALVAVAPTSTPQPTNPPATPGHVVDLGPLGAADNLDGTLSFSWIAYSGGSFGGYELVYETTASAQTPSFLTSSPTWAAPAQTDTSAVIGRPAPGSYQVRLQAIASVDGQAVVVAQTSIIHVHISAPAAATP